MNKAKTLGWRYWNFEDYNHQLQENDEDSDVFGHIDQLMSLLSLAQNKELVVSV